MSKIGCKTLIRIRKYSILRNSQANLSVKVHSQGKYKNSAQKCKSTYGITHNTTKQAKFSYKLLKYVLHRQITYDYT